jgi:hypothetical protein
MKKLTMILCAVSFSAGSAMAAPNYSLSWDWDDWTTQGWVITPGTGGAGSIDPNPVENNADNIPDPSNNTGSIYLPDTAYAAYYLPQSTNSFIFSAEVAGARMDVNRLQAAGLAYRHTYDYDTTNPNSLSPPDAVTAWLEGKDAGSERIIFKDTYADGNYTDDNMRWLKASDGSVGVVETIRLTIDYNATVPGTILLYGEPVDYLPNAGNEPSPYTYGAPIHINAATGDYEEINMIRLGGAYSWSQFYADNASFVSVPEPNTLFLLALGILPLFKRRRTIK